jgi:hypothetical protein
MARAAKQSKNQQSKPWEIVEDGVKVKLTYNVEHRERLQYNKDARAQRAMEWTATQPSTETAELAAKAGIGNWVVVNDAAAQQALDYAREIANTSNKAEPSKVALLKALNFVLLPRDQEGASQREAGILDGSYVDLPVASVRSIKTRLSILEQVTGKHAAKAVHRAFRILGCGQEYDSETENPTTGEITITRRVDYCRIKSCGQHECAYKAFHQLKSRFQTQLKATFTKAINTNTKLYHLTLETNWALPTQEAKYKTGLPTTPSQSSNRTPKDQNLYRERMDQHLDNMRRFFKHCHAIEHTPHRVSEVAFLFSSQPGVRSWPNPHTHAVIQLSDSASYTDNVKNIEAKVKQHSTATITPLNYENDLKGQTASLANYDAKHSAITPSDEHMNCNDEHGIYGSDLYVALDESSLFELVFREDERLEHMHCSSKKRAQVVDVELKPDVIKLGNIHSTQEKKLVLKVNTKKPTAHIVRSEWKRSKPTKGSECCAGHETQQQGASLSGGSLTSDSEASSTSKPRASESSSLGSSSGSESSTSGSESSVSSSGSGYGLELRVGTHHRASPVHLVTRSPQPDHMHAQLQCTQEDACATNSLAVV